MVGGPRGIRVGIVRIGFAKHDTWVGHKAGVRNSGWDSADVGVGRLVFVHAFKARSGMVVDQHGCDGVFGVANLEESGSGVDGCGDEECSAGGERNDSVPAEAAGVAI